MHSELHTLKDFFLILPGMEKEEFLKTYPDPFLVQNKALETPDEDAIHFTTMRFSKNDMDGSLSAALRERGKSRVICVRKLSTLNAFLDMITIGRANNNDISLPFASISKFHAYFKNADDSYTITDANSTNGTFVNHTQLDPDVPQKVNDGDSISISPQTEFTFYLAGSYFDWVSALLTSDV